MNWDDLRLFIAVARAERLGAAAAIVGQDATTVSRRLKRLEQTLEQRLFEHTPSGHVLTDHGTRLLEQAERMEAAALGIERNSGDGGAEIAGAIRLSVSEGFGTRIIAPRLREFTAQHPRVQIDLIASSGVLNPSRREADLAVMLARPKAGPLVTRRLTDYRLGLYATLAYLDAASPLAEPAHLIRHILVGYVPDQIYAPELRYLAEIDARLEPGIRSTSIAAQAEIIASGAGCGILPCFMGDAVPGLVRILPEAIDIERTFWLVVPRDLRGIARIDRFVGWLAETTGSLREMLLGLRTRPA
jgi:DNA-binding transcriptional LysR family regulator